MVKFADAWKFLVLHLHENTSPPLSFRSEGISHHTIFHWLFQRRYLHAVVILWASSRKMSQPFPYKDPYWSRLFGDIVLGLLELFSAAPTRFLTCNARLPSGVPTGSPPRRNSRRWEQPAQAVSGFRRSACTILPRVQSGKFSDFFLGTFYFRFFRFATGNGVSSCPLATCLSHVLKFLSITA